MGAQAISEQEDSIKACRNLVQSDSLLAMDSPQEAMEVEMQLQIEEGTSQRRSWPVKSVAVALVVLAVVGVASTMGGSQQVLMSDHVPQMKYSPDHAKFSEQEIAWRIVNEYREPERRGETPRTMILSVLGEVKELPNWPHDREDLWIIKTAVDHTGAQVKTLRPVNSITECLKLRQQSGINKPGVVACNEEPDKTDKGEGQVMDVVSYDGLLLYNPHQSLRVICAALDRDKRLGVGAAVVGRAGRTIEDNKRECTWRLEATVNPFDAKGGGGDHLVKMHKEAWNNHAGYEGGPHNGDGGDDF